MSCPQLPDEIISEILSPALKISDKDFSDNMSISPFASSSGSTSAFLLVCKAWLRVSTPLLYHVVIIRSKAQARALETALKSNKDLGAFIKKLRVEGGFGLTMKTILQCSPNITDLFMSMAIWSSDGVAGLCQGLHLIDPLRLVLHDAEQPGSNKQNLLLVQKLSQCMNIWKKLRIVDLPCAHDWQIDIDVGRSSQICAAIMKAPSLEEIVMPIPSYLRSPSFVADIRAMSSLKTLKIKLPVSLQDPIIETINADPILKDLVRYSVWELDGFPEIAPSANPSFVPMESASPEVQDKIWSRILYFAFNIDVLDEEVASDVHILKTSSDSEQAIMGCYPATDALLVSQQLKRLSIPYFNRHILLNGPSALAQFSAMLLGKPTLSRHIRSLAVNTQPVWSDIISFNFNGYEHTDASDTEEIMRPILPLLGGLVSFTGGYYDISLFPPHPQITQGSLAIPWDIFQTLGTVAGASLRRFCLEVVPPAQVQSHLVFEPFLALKSLEWKCLVEFSLDTVPPWTSGALANLECLSLVDNHPSFLSILSTAELPSLRRVYFHTKLASSAEGFLERHGSKLTQIMLQASEPGTINVLDACPSLPLLICCTSESMFRKNVLPSIKLFSPSEPHLSLEKIILEELLESSRKEEKAMHKFLEALNTEMLPALREIQIYDLYWPTTEREIAKSFWVDCAEKLLKKNLKLTDTSGRHWTPRLKTAGKR
ncbi:hypothetical protein FB451DRAFT_710125 [Mycena latifolia]|nr:hypothetical protein FB451DRAFT_710125 [Mycena latifolia]